MGGPKTGKSALVSQFLWECFMFDYRPTVEEFNWVEYGCIEQKSGGPNFMLQLIDSSGSRDFLAMRHLYYRIADAFMVVYAADDPQSYAEALTMLKEIGEQNTKNAPILLIQNKSDLVPRVGGDTPPSPALLPDEEKDEQLLVASVRRMRISAKNLEQVKGAFSWLIEELVRRSENIFSSTQIDGKQRPTIITTENTNGIIKGRKRNGSGPTTNGFLPSNNGKVALLTRRRQSMPSRRTASELGIDEQALKQFMKRYENQQGRNVGCCVQ
uniref:Ras-domain-containing protein n=1 Tax=Meloidogyne hapla TaxID=6305 RepID=A0A1I8AZC7_MELHA